MLMKMLHFKVMKIRTMLYPSTLPVMYRIDMLNFFYYYYYLSTPVFNVCDYKFYKAAVDSRVVWFIDFVILEKKKIIENGERNFKNLSKDKNILNFFFYIIAY